MHVPRPHLRPPPIHWRRYLERKIILLTSLVVVTFIMENYLHLHQTVVHQFHDLTVGVLAEHLIFGIPLGD